MAYAVRRACDPRTGAGQAALNYVIAGCQALQVFDVGLETPARSWVDYLQGVTAGLIRRGHIVRGFDVRVESTVPLGSGVSSSAALEVAFARALRMAVELDPRAAGTIPSTKGTL